MRLSKLTLNGFKSFADKTEIAFSAPMVGIVGPNGCGKSNVVDAIKWVLGEQSAKSLRGGAMLDVIFNGSSARKPAGMASVTLHFENLADDEGKRRLPFETDEVTVNRRLFRDGTSEYLINRKRARLRDIRNLFYDTGIGTQAYCIIEQGKVDAMLVSNPVDRRMIFEEAAGISKFKAQKKEAARKLDRTEQNLLRSRDKLEEVRKRLRSVKIQATKAKNFQDYAERLKILRLEHALADYHRLRVELDELNTNVTELEQQRQRAVTQLTAVEDQRSAAESERQQLMSEQRELEQQRVRVESQRDQARQRQQFAVRTLNELDESIEREKQQQQELVQKVEQLDQQAAEQQEAVARYQEQLESSQSRIEAAQAEQREKQHAHNEAQAQLEDEKAGIVTLLRRTTDLHNRINSLDQEQKNLATHRERLTSRADELAEQLETLLTHRDDLTAKLKDADALIETEKARLEEQKTALADLSTQQRELAERLATAKEKRSGLVSRQSLLDELEQAQTGLDDAVKAILARKAADDSAFPFIRGLLAELISTDVDRAAAVEAALGEHQQMFVADRLADVQAAGEELDSLTGRVTIAALDQIEPVRYDADEAAKDRPTLIDHVWFDAALAPLAWKLLGRTLIASDLDEALAFRAELPGGYRFVTQHGEVLEADGCISVGPIGEASGTGLISRRSELAQLHTDIAELDERIEADQQALSQLSDRASHVENVQQELRQAIYEASTIKVELTSKLEQAADSIARIEREQPTIAAEVEQIHNQIQNAGEKREAHAADAAALETQEAESRERVDEIQQQLSGLKEAADEAAERVTGLRIEGGKLSEQLSAAQRQHRQLGLAKDDAQRQMQHASQRLNQHEQRIEQMQQQRDESAEQIEKSEAAFAEVSEQLTGFTEKIADIAANLEQLNRALREHRSEAQRHDGQLHKHQVRQRELEVRLDGVRERASEQLSLEIEQAYEDYEPHEVDWPELEREIKELRQKIDRLGNVNLEAIDELTELEKREEDLGSQLQDVEEARDELQHLIAYLDEESRKRFEETFTQIREHFAGPDGLFRKLFGGGRADLMLMADENGDTDWLESGIEVVAKPPGKEPQSIRLLSGGERTMVAVALLMSIFRSRPSPFCVLDEVDAALDEMNVDRFTEVLRGFLDSSHFILITHHKRTMQAADLLYGITMPIRGISKQVTVKFEQVGAGGRLSDDAVAAAANAPALPDDDEDDEREPARINTQSSEKLAQLADGRAPVQVRPS
ncbi:MAG: chromosome segregation protein SMC [Phycisphaeraceae bacterium]